MTRNIKRLKKIGGKTFRYLGTFGGAKKPTVKSIERNMSIRTKYQRTLIRTFKAKSYGYTIWEVYFRNEKR